MTVTDQTLVVAAEGVAASDLAGEIVLLDINAGTYYGLNEVGARVWQVIQQRRRIDEIHTLLLDEYEVDPARCKEDLIQLLQSLHARHLIRLGQPEPLPFAS